MKYILTLYFTVVFFKYNYGQSNSRITNDNPRQTISVQTVPKKWLQVEAGLGVKVNKVYSLKTSRYALPSLLFRYGLSKRIEARLLTGIAYSRYHFRSGTIDRKSDTWGSGPVELGGKLHILDEKKVRPSISFSAHYRFNNNLKLSTDTINGGNFRFSFQNIFSEKFQLDYSTGIDWISWKAPERYIYTISPVLHFNEKWSGYIEASGIIWSSYSPLHFIRTGARFNPAEHYSFDIIAGKAWNRKERGYIIESYPRGDIALQFSWRFSTSKK
ncbi:MAG TPA: hypothetical protein PKU77_13795 [Ferruginibacter sp.]|nr:hypothetical protein [Ferruginibacter sp.]